MAENTLTAVDDAARLGPSPFYKPHDVHLTSTSVYECFINCVTTTPIMMNGESMAYTKTTRSPYTITTPPVRTRVRIITERNLGKTVTAEESVMTGSPLVEQILQAQMYTVTETAVPNSYRDSPEEAIVTALPMATSREIEDAQAPINQGSNEANQSANRLHRMSHDVVRWFG